MEANKEEAMRAKELATKALSQGQFNRALKMATKAEHLHPALEVNRMQGGGLSLSLIAGAGGHPHCGAHLQRGGATDRQWQDQAFGLVQRARRQCFPWRHCSHCDPCPLPDPARSAGQCHQKGLSPARKGALKPPTPHIQCTGVLNRPSDRWHTLTRPRGCHAVRRHSIW